jgi:hypothetical protein
MNPHIPFAGKNFLAFGEYYYSSCFAGLALDFAFEVVASCFALVVQEEE